MKKVKINEINLDPVLLEIRPVDMWAVSRYRQAMRNGDKFPPMLVDSDLSLVSGYHRHQTYLQEYGPDHVVSVIVKKYKAEADRIEDAVRENSRHGVPLDGISRKRVIHKLAELGRKPEAIAKLLGIAVKRVEELAGFSVIIRGTGKKITRKPVKAGAQSIVGRVVEQVEYQEHNEKDMGIPPAQCANQLIRWLKNGWIDWEDKPLADSLNELAGLIAKRK